MRYERSWTDWLKDAIALCVAFGMAAMLAWLYYITMTSGVFQ